MKIFSIIALVICVIYTITCCRSFFMILYHNNKLKKLSKHRPKKTTEFYILLPGLREQKLVKETIEWFNKMNYEQTKLHICIVTTQREENEYQLKNETTQTTRQVTQKFLEENNTKFETINIHYPFIKGNKASQLNYAIRTILEERKPKDCYFAMFDFDSRPKEDYFQLASALIDKENEPDIVQSVPFFVKNIDELSKKKSNFILVMHALEQATRSGCIEIWNLLANSKNVALSPLYAMGASLIVKQSTLIEQDFIPEPVDDIPLGFRYFINKKRFSYLPTLVLGDIPEKTKQIFSQSVLIQKGNLQSLKEIRRKGTAKNTFFRRLWIVYEFISSYIFKMTMPYILLIYLLLNIATPNLICLFIILLPTFRFISGSIITKILAKKDINIATYFISFLLCFIHPFCLTYGPAKALLLEIKKLINKKDIVYTKTER